MKNFMKNMYTILSCIFIFALDASQKPCKAQRQKKSTTSAISKFLFVPTHSPALSTHICPPGLALDVDIINEGLEDENNAGSDGIQLATLESRQLFNRLSSMNQKCAFGEISKKDIEEYSHLKAEYDSHLRSLFSLKAQGYADATFRAIDNLTDSLKSGESKN